MASMRRKFNSQICNRCGWARRYHVGLNGDGRILIRGVECSAFVGPHPEIPTQKTVPTLPVIVTAPVLLLPAPAQTEVSYAAA